MASLSDWGLDPELAFLNHGSFGATPIAVLEEQARLRARMEADPVRFFAFDLDDLMVRARLAAARFVGADPDGFAFVTNATTGTNALLRSAPIERGDEILLTDHGYEACNLAAELIAKRRGATVRFARLPSPVSDGAEAREAILASVTDHTRFAVIDHVTSPTALVLPIEEIVADLAARGVETIVDGAHAPGQVDLDVEAIGAAGYTANWHKWTCAPKGAGFLWARSDWRDSVLPLVISHGAGEPDAPGARFRAMFDWTGTADPTPYLTVPAALECIAGMMEGGWPAVRRRNSDVAREWRRRLVERGFIAAGGESLVGSMVSVRVPDRMRPPGAPREAGRALQHRLDVEHRVSIAAATLRYSDDLLIRISAHLHTPPETLDRLVEALDAL